MSEAKTTNSHIGGNCEIFNAVMSFGLIANARNALPFFGAPGSWICFQSDPFNATQPHSEFVLLNPAMAADKIAKIVPVLTARNTPSGYRLRDAVQYRNVFAVGFTKTELNEQAQSDLNLSLKTLLKSADTQLTLVKPNNAAQELAAALQ
jgi:hypothetical protein